MASRALGDGIISRVLKRFAFINDNKLGKIYFPIDANLLATCSDMRERFEEGERVLFSAQKQIPPKNDCSFTACSVVKPDELVSVDGVIVSVSDKFAYAETTKLGRVFIPFSARTKRNEVWAGSGVEMGVHLSMDVMPQISFNGCQYVAYQVAMGNDDKTMQAHTELLELGNGREPTLECPLTTQSHTKLERQPDRVDGQVGIIVASNDREAYVYSAQTGMCYLSARSSGIKKMDVYFPAGSWATYDVIKKPSTTTNIGCSWIGTKISPYDAPVGIETSFERHAQANTLTVKGYGVVCRVNPMNRCAWLWNDHIGRVYVNNSDYTRADDFAPMQSFDVVDFSVTFKGAFEDVPWNAYDVVKARNRNIEDCAKLLVTDDNWKVLYVKPQPNGAFFGFLEHENYGSAFFAWTDMTGDQMLTANALCRVSAFKQHRDTKHRWRAILVTPLDAKGRPQYPHPKPPKAKVLPTPIGDRSTIRPPAASVWAQPQAQRILPPGLSENISVMNLGVSLSQQYNQQQHYGRIDLLDSSEGLERELELADWDEDDNIPATNGFHHALLEDKKTPSSRSSEVGASVFRTGPPSVPDMSLLRGTLLSQTNDKTTQTDLFNEHIILRDIIGDPELLTKIITKFPSHTERILGIKWQN